MEMDVPTTNTNLSKVSRNPFQSIAAVMQHGISVGALWSECASG